MAVNLMGLVAGATAFLSIWIGHVSVRQVETRVVKLWQPMLVFLFLGLAMELAAVLSTTRLLSTLFGIVGFSLLWDVLELKRQEKRVGKGHAPANPGNPRHMALLHGAIPRVIKAELENFGLSTSEAGLAEPKTLASRK